MKRCFLPPLLLILLFLSACDYQELTLNQDADRLAPKLGVAASDIQFLSHADFITKTEENREIVAMRGVVAVTDKELRLLTHNKKHLFSTDVIRVPLYELNGIAEVGTQVHLRQGHKVIVLDFSPNSANSFQAMNAKKFMPLLSTLRVPSFEVSGTRIFPRFMGMYRGYSNTMNRRYRDPIHSDGGSWRDDYETPYYGSPIRNYPSDSDPSEYEQ